MNNQNQSPNADSAEKLAKESGANSSREGREAMQGAKGSPTETQHARKGSFAHSAEDASSEKDEDIEMELADSDKDETDEIDLQGTEKSDLGYRKGQEDSSAHH